MKKHFVIVGAGMGGLAAALRLSHLGHKVTVLEKTGDVGGRNRKVMVNKCQFDGGPTLLMMLEPFRKLFEDVGESLEAHLALKRMDPGYRVFYRDGTRLESSPDRQTMERTIREIFGEADARGYSRLMVDLERMNDVAMPNFVSRNFDRPWQLLNPRVLGSVLRHGMMRNLFATISKYVQDPRLRMLFSFQTMYLGLSPYEAPWVYATLTYMEFGEGIYYPDGGLIRLAEVIAHLACDRGATILLESPVCRVDGKKVLLESGRVIEADAVVVNADLPYAYETLTKEPLADKTHSCSASVHYFDYEGELPELLHHNVFFGQDFRQNLDEIFSQSSLPTDPAFYVAVSSRTDGNVAPPGHMNLMILIPCPNLDFGWSAEAENRLLDQALTRLEGEVGFDRSRVRGHGSVGPQYYREELNLSKGAAFGLSHHLRQSAIFRPQNLSKANPHLYFVGASTIPGNGLPMVLISADLAVQRMRRTFG